jgi:DNA (cytosine-5)-methyltransferase 1
MRELALFAGAGGGILGGHLLGWRTVCAVEWDAYAASVLVARQNDGCLAPFPIWDDVQTFDGRPWRGRVDVVSGGFPCTDISVAGKGAGIDGQASGMWRHMARIIGEVRPRYVFVENSPMLVHRGLARVVGDLASLGFDARWGVLGAHDVGALHKRDRIWIVADADDRRGDGAHDEVCAGWHEPFAGGAYVADATSAGWQGRSVGDGMHSETSGNGRSEFTRSSGRTDADVVDADGAGREKQRRILAAGAQHGAAERPGWWSAEPDVGRMAHGVAARVDRLRCLGNGQVPRVAAAAWRMLGGGR